MSTSPVNAEVSNSVKESTASSVTGPVRILVIEDNHDDRNILLRQLQKAGVEERVMCVDDGNAALNLFEEGASKLSSLCAVFLDLSLPGISGQYLLHAIRSRVSTALLPIFVVTGSSNPAVQAECLRLGATGFIPKELVLLPRFRSTLAEMLSAKKTEGAPESANSLQPTEIAK